MQRLPVKLFLLTKLELLLRMKVKLLLLTLSLPNLPNKKKYRRDATGVAWLGGMTERRRTLAVMGVAARSTWADHRLPTIRRRKPAR